MPAIKLGGEIVEKQKSSQWGDGFLTQLSQDLMTEFPDVKGFSKRNLEQIRRWYSFWSDLPAIAKQVASQLVQIPWWHNVIIVTKCQNHKEALFYVQNTQQHGWSRNVLVHQIESGLYQRELEQGLTQHITQFLLELGAGFAYLGKQVPLTAGEKDFYIDLLFYHLKLRCYVVIELKTGEFAPEHTGKLNFYLTAVDKQLKTEQDNHSIGERLGVVVMDIKS